MVGGRGLRSDVCSNEKAEPHNVIVSASPATARGRVFSSEWKGASDNSQGAPRQEAPMNIGEGLIWRPR